VSVNIYIHKCYRLCKCTCAASTIQSCHYTATSSTTTTDCAQHALTTSGRPHSAQQTHTMQYTMRDHTSLQMLTSACLWSSSWTTTMWPFVLAW